MFTLSRGRRKNVNHLILIVIVIVITLADCTELFGFMNSLFGGLVLDLQHCKCLSSYV